MQRLLSAGKRVRRCLEARRRIGSIAWREARDGSTMNQTLPVDVRGEGKANPIGAKSMSGWAYAAIPVRWKESGQIPTIGKLTGELAGMLKDRTLHIVGVPANPAVGTASTGQSDVVVRYKGDAVKIFRSRKSFSIFGSMFGRLSLFSEPFLYFSMHPGIERLTNPHLMKAFYAGHRQI